MNAIFLILLFLLTSCFDINGRYCADPSEYNKSEAKFYYDSFGVYKTSMSVEKAKKLFGCNYRNGDAIYVYSALWGKKFILVRYNLAITYAEEE